MAGLPWIPLDVRFPTGGHAIALGVALQDPWAWKYAVRLWAWSAQHQADGRFEGPAAEAQIEHAAGWTGTPGAFVEAMSLKHIALLDVTTRGFYIHNWHLHCGAHIEKRAKDRARKRKDPSVEVPRKLRGGKKEPRRNSDRSSLSPSPSPSPCLSPSPSSSPLVQIASVQLPTVSSSVGGCRGEHEN